MSTAYLLAGMLTFLIAGGLIWGLRRSDRVLQYPFVVSVAWAVFMLPMIYQIVLDPHMFPHCVLTNHGIEGAILVGILCLVMGWCGFALGRNSRPILMPRISMERLFVSGCVLYAVSAAGMYRLLESCGGWRSALFEGAYYSADRAGRIVIWNWVARFAYPAFLLVWWSTLRKPTRAKWIAVLASLAIPVFQSVVWGRRSLTLMFIAMVFGAGYFVRGWRLPRILTAAGIVLVLLIIALAPVYRAMVARGEFRQILEINVADEMRKYALDSPRNGYAILVYLAALPDVELGDYSWGAGIWDRFVYFCIPRQLVGDSVKASLYVGSSSLLEKVREVFGYERPTGMFLGGPADAFTQGGYAGSLLYLLLGWAFGKWWRSTTPAGSDICRLTYLYVLFVAVYGTAASITGALSMFLVNLAVVGLVMSFAIQNRRVLSTHSRCPQCRMLDPRPSRRTVP